MFRPETFAVGTEVKGKPTYIVNTSFAKVTKTLLSAGDRACIAACTWAAEEPLVRPVVVRPLNVSENVPFEAPFSFTVQTLVMVVAEAIEPFTSSVPPWIVVDPL